MNRSESHDHPIASHGSSFGTTRWSLILAARNRGTPQADEALAALCSAYWYPLYAFIRRRGHDPDRAADLTQGFFARLLEKEDFGSADPSRGRFRAFLLAACKNFLANAHDRDMALKRGADGSRSRSTGGAPRGSTSLSPPTKRRPSTSSSGGGP
jgi:RNA polymerase sigma-70 factor (ECF subfamily)